MVTNKKVLKITTRDIAEGKRKSYCECPIALAARRAWRAPLDRRLTVRHEGIFVGDFEDDVLWSAELPPELRRFMERFDKGLPVQPLTMSVTFR
jgi:hypothetical protein